MFFNFRSIRRIIFYSLIKPVVNEDGDKEMDVISISQALQIAGKCKILIFIVYVKVRYNDRSPQTECSGHKHDC